MERRVITLEGLVQGVGFRPFVFGLATRCGLAGTVRNSGGAVLIEVEGPPDSLDSFLVDLKSSAPPLARVDSIEWRTKPANQLAGFRIEQSTSDSNGPLVISPDIATCPECLAELLDPYDRRNGYPFLNCTNCGPRLTIIRGGPYDRCRTTMAGFEMCPDCRTEYEDPRDRRFHAQPTACATCGPQLEAVTDHGRTVITSQPLELFAELLLQGQIGAMKGLGGYHLVCDARNQAVVGELRRRKQREEMPLAVLVRDAEAARRLCRVSIVEQALMESPRRPIVLLRRLEASGVCDAVAPHNPNLGLMLPYTPLHHLLSGAVGDIPLVMTSGNRSHEPIAYEDDDAMERLGDVADVILRHNRPIHVRCDDSVTRIVAGAELPIRRSRGYAPLPIPLVRDCSVPMLAVGGQFKAVFGLARGQRAILSQHLGDLDHYAAYRQFERDIALFEQLFHAPELIVHDLHPDYLSTRYAQERAARENLSLLGVQHHHAHMASCMADNGLDEPVIGVTFDGTGFGRDEATGATTIWGGEFLVGDFGGFRRAAHLRNVAMAGGNQAVKEPWRMAVAHLVDAGCGTSLFADRVPYSTLRTVEKLLARGMNVVRTSSAGRLFDAVAAIAGLRDRVSYEGQAAMELEWAATDVPVCGEYDFEIQSPRNDSEPFVFDPRPMIRAVAADVANGTTASHIARRFHSSLVTMIVEACRRIRDDVGLESVVLSGGVFMNALLLAETIARLADVGFRVYRHRQVPANDAGLCLGQLAVAAATQALPARNTAEPRSTLVSENQTRVNQTPVSV